MASDWIKMRTDLYRDPKVSVIADFLSAGDSELSRYVNQNMQRNMTVTRNVMRNVTVGALISVWGVLRHRGKRVDDDLVIKGCTTDIIDDIADLPGFGAAMVLAGWARKTSQGFTLQRFFEEFNVAPDEEMKKKNAERQRRYREKSREKSNEKRNVTVAPQSNTEKRREEKSIKKKEKKENAAAPLSVSSFDAWWKIYPKKSGREAAHRAYAAVLKRLGMAGQKRGDTEALLLEAVTVYAASPKAKSAYCWNPATWLNQGHWEDDSAVWQRGDEETKAHPVRESTLPFFSDEAKP